LIPNGSMDTEIWSSLEAGGSIDAVTGVYTSGVVEGTYLNDACVDGTYKAGAASDCADVLIVSTQALTGMVMAKDPLDGVVVMEKWILDTVDAIGDHTDDANGIGGYVDELNYPGGAPDVSPIEVIEVRGGDTPFGSVFASNIQNDLGVTSLTGLADPTNVQAPVLVARVALIVNACTDVAVTLDDTFTQVTNGDGGLIPEEAPSTLTFRRGDAKADGNINIADALFGAQFLAGLRALDPVGGDKSLVHPLNMASVKHDTGGDKMNIADVLFIAQRLVGLRDNCFEIV